MTFYLIKTNEHQFLFDPENVSLARLDFEEERLTIRIANVSVDIFDNREEILALILETKRTKSSVIEIDFKSQSESKISSNKKDSEYLGYYDTGNIE